MTIFWFLATNSSSPSIQNKKNVTSYSNKLVKICCDEQKCLSVFEKSIEVIKKIGLRKDRDEFKPVSYANAVKNIVWKN